MTKYNPNCVSESEHTSSVNISVFKYSVYLIARCSLREQERGRGVGDVGAVRGQLHSAQRAHEHGQCYGQRQVRTLI